VCDGLPALVVVTGAKDMTAVQIGRDPERRSAYILNGIIANIPLLI